MGASSWRGVKAVPGVLGAAGSSTHYVEQAVSSMSDWLSHAGGVVMHGGLPDVNPKSGHVYFPEPTDDDRKRARNYLRDQAQRYLSHTDRGVRDLSIYAQSQLGDFEDVNG